ncbi:hypothetical protein SUGI_0892700 [Cryptomeria japonica]|nr:hypothetical protein SUGI_0892700 [Cryptomeria japonica]
MDAQREECLVNVSQDSSGHEAALQQDQEQKKDPRTKNCLVAFKMKPAPFYLDEQSIYPAPLCLKNDNTVSFYHPKEISFGPWHFDFCPKYFKKEENSVNLIELWKSEIAWNFDGLESMVEDLKSETIQKKLKKSYGETRKDPEVLAWLLARDGCFVLEVLGKFEDPPKAENGHKTQLQHILDRKNHHPLLNDIVKDMFKLENQLPLWVLEKIKETMEGHVVEVYWFEGALKNLSPVEVKGGDGNREYKKGIHLLQLLGEYMVDNGKSSEVEKNKNQDSEGAKQSKRPQANNAECLKKQASQVE